jgi:hypothetical protein
MEGVMNKRNKMHDFKWLDLWFEEYYDMFGVGGTKIFIDPPRDPYAGFSEGSGEWYSFGGYYDRGAVLTWTQDWGEAKGIEGFNVHDTEEGEGYGCGVVKNYGEGVSGVGGCMNDRNCYKVKYEQ